MSVVRDGRRLGSLSSARVVMIGAVVGAAVALTAAVTWTPSNADTAATNGDAPNSPAGGSGETVETGFTAPVGTCLDWDSDDASDIEPVSCAEAHKFEVTEVIDISSDYPAEASLPETEEWETVAKERCTDGVETYLDSSLDPEGKLSVSALRPNDADWNSGTRELRCGVWRTGPGGSPQAIEGPAVEQNQSDVWASGTCLDIEDKSVGDPVSCSNKHSYEIVGLVDLSDEFDEYPSEAEQDEWLDEECEQVVDDYTGGDDLDENLVVTWDKRSEESWDAGSYLVNCKVGAILDDESGLASVTGSVKASDEDSDSDDGSDGDDNDADDDDSDDDGDSGDGGESDDESASDEPTP